jgi:hypothetical protein
MKLSAFPAASKHVVALAVALSCVSGARAASPEQEELERLRATTQALIQALVDQGLISRERADALLKQTAPRTPAAAAAATAGAVAGAAIATPPPSTGVVRVPYVPETVKAQMREEIKNEVLMTAREERWADARQLPEWVRRFTFEGDLRVRAQGDVFADDNEPASSYRQQVQVVNGQPAQDVAWSPDITNTTTNRQRLTLRGRLGVTAKVSEDVVSGLRLTTMGSPSQVSASQTLGTYSGRLQVGLDRAFIRWEPRYNLRFDAGRMANPFYGSDLLWPEDLSLDGISARGDYDVASGVVAFATAGAFALEELNLSKSDKWLYGVQVGADWAVADKTQLKFGLGFYDFQNVEGIRETGPKPTGAAADTVAYQTSQYPKSARLRGNTLINLNAPGSTDEPVWGLASKFRPVNAMVGVMFSQLAPINVGLSLDYVKNSAFDLGDIKARARTTAVDDLAEKTTGYQFRAQFGALQLSEPGSWQGFVAYRKFERDAWLDAFTDTTWNLGGTSYKGFQIGGGYAFDRNTWLNMKWTSTRNLDDGRRYELTPGDPLSTVGNMSSAPLKIDVLQVEVNTRF